MNVFELTRALVDIESITENECQVGEFLHGYIAKLAARSGGRVEKMAVEPGRFNVLACWGEPRVTLSTHMDTVPPFFPSREDAAFIWGRGACDAKGIIAAMVAAAERLLGEGAKNFCLLFVVGEERNSAGAAVAAKAPRGSKYLVNGEPTENKLALASKGVLRFELVARGRMAHSAYPELGESAIEALLDALEAIREIPLPKDALLGTCTMNIGTISGGRAPNVIADAAKAEIMLRLVGDPAPIREAIIRAVGTRAQADRDSFYSTDQVPQRRWIAHDRCVLRNGRPDVRDELGRAAAAWAGQHPCGAHVGGADFETGTVRCRRNLRKRGKEAVGEGVRKAEMNLAIVGYGKMGHLIEQLAPEYGFDVKLRLDIDNNAKFEGFTKENFRGVDAAVEFSTPATAPENIERLAGLGVNSVIGTTGWFGEMNRARAAVERGGTGLVWSSNFSVGVNIFNQIVAEAARLFAKQPEYGAWAWEIHHATKKDAPSGTLLALVEKMKQSGYTKPIDTSSSRAGAVPGTHEIGFDSAADTITIRHTARSREGFARGALRAARWVAGKKGFFDFREIVNELE